MYLEDFHNRRLSIAKERIWHSADIVISNYYRTESLLYLDKKSYDSLDNLSYLYYILINERNNWIAEKCSSIE